MIKDNEIWLAIIGAVILGFIFGCLVTSTSAHRAAIEQSCAYYDSKTGEFKWGPVQ